MSTILNHIIENRKMEVKYLKKFLPLTELKNLIHLGYQPNSMRKALLSEGASGIIAEFKRRSPSKGIINDSLSPEIVTMGYAEAGASGLSVLTEDEHFGGGNKDFIEARKANPFIPMLRKDFIVDEYQIYESKILKADVILLIAAVLDKGTINEFVTLAHSLRMEVLLELHDEEELEKLDERADMIGINNRNLKDFSVDLDRSVKLLEKLPKEAVKVSESGISDPGTVNNLRLKGFNGFLMGENFMKANNPADACQKFIANLVH